jgi:hypothetical protein
MSTKYYCDKCGKQIPLKGNQKNETLYGRSPMKEDGWQIEFNVHREYNGGSDDLCKLCCVEIIKGAVSHL